MYRNSQNPHKGIYSHVYFLNILLALVILLVPQDTLMNSIIGACMPENDKPALVHRNVPLYIEWKQKWVVLVSHMLVIPLLRLCFSVVLFENAVSNSFLWASFWLCFMIGFTKQI